MSTNRWRACVVVLVLFLASCGSEKPPRYVFLTGHDAYLFRADRETGEAWFGAIGEDWQPVGKK